LYRPLEKSVYQNVCGEELFPNDLTLPIESSSSKILENLQSSLNEFASKPMEM